MSLELRQVNKVFFDGQNSRGVENLSFRVEKGEGFSVLGPSGCGKTTCLRLIAGLETPDSGEIFHHGENITTLPAQKRNIRTIFQKYALFPHLNTWENIVFGLRMKKMPEKELQKKGTEALDLLEITRLKNSPVSKLSGGEQQRVAIARALVTEPEILLLDEPLSALDLKLRERMQMELLALRKKLGNTFIFVTHDQSEAMALSDRVAVMCEGKIVQIASPKEIYERPKTKFVANFIGKANFLGKQEEENLILKGSPPTKASTSEWMIRPEAIQIHEKNHTVRDDELGLQAIVQESIFLGDHQLVKVLSKEKSFLIRLKPEENISPPGTTVLMTWHREQMCAVSS